LAGTVVNGHLEVALVAMTQLDADLRAGGLEMRIPSGVTADCSFAVRSHSFVNRLVRINIFVIKAVIR
jgi:hypothetical protein